MAGVAGAEGDGLAQARNSGLSVLVIRVGGAGLAYVVQVLLARLMGKADYGIFATASVAATMLGHACLWGIGQSICRFVPSHRASGRNDLVRGFLLGGAAFALVSGFATAALGGVLLWAGRDLVSPAYLAPLAIALAVVPLFALQDYAEGVARSFNWTALAIAPPYVLRQGLVVAAMLGLVGGGVAAEPRVAIAAILVATALTLVAQGSMLSGRLRREFPLAGPRAYHWRDWANTSLPIAFVDFTILGFGFIDVGLLGFFVSPEEVGVYFAATRILQFVAFVQYAATAATAPRFSDAQARGNRAALAALAGRTARLTLGGTAAVGAAVILASPVLFALFGPGFSASIPILAILIAGLVAQSAFGPGEDLLNMLGAERLCALLSLLALALAAVLNLVLIPRFGVTGAAAAMALAGLARAAALAIAAGIRLGVTSHVFRWARA